MLHRKLDRDYITDGDGSGIYGGLQLGPGFLGQGGASPEKNAAGDPGSPGSREIKRTYTCPLTTGPSPALGGVGPKSIGSHQGNKHIDTRYQTKSVNFLTKVDPIPVSRAITSLSSQSLGPFAKEFHQRHVVRLMGKDVDKLDTVSSKDAVSDVG